MAVVARLYNNGDLRAFGTFIEEDSAKPQAYANGDFKATTFDEVGVTSSLTNWYPLDGDSKEYISQKDATVNGAVVAAGLKQSCYSFDGIDDYLKVTENFTTGFTALTFSLWIKPVTGGSTYRCALCKSPNGLIGDSEYWAGISAGGYLTATIGAKTGPGWAAGETNITAVMNTWYHLVATWDGTTVKVYVDGVEKKSYALASNTSINYPTRFGSSTDGATYQYAGSIQDIRFYNRALSIDEIKLLYDLTAISQMKLTSSTVYLRGEVLEVE